MSAASLAPLLTGCAAFGYPAPGASSGGPYGPIGTPRATSSPEEGPARGAADGARSAGAGSYVVFGQRYYVMASAEGYREVGVASWYGDEFAGRPTSTGEIFDPRRLTAAHRSLPLPTWVEVTNLDNGRRIVLRVNDRGPFADVDRRIIDVSYAAARQLGMLIPGLARVEVRALSEDEVRSLGDS